MTFIIRGMSTVMIVSLGLPAQAGAPPSADGFTGVATSWLPCKGSRTKKTPPKRGFLLSG